MTTALHSGKLGDIIYSIPVLREIGVKRLFLNSHERRTMEPVMDGRLMVQMANFLNQSCPWLQTTIWNNEKFDYDLDRFRLYAEADPTTHLVQCHRMAVGYPDDLQFDTSPWLKVKPARIRPVIIHASMRNQGDGTFDWKALAPHTAYCAFVGMFAELHWFYRKTGLAVIWVMPLSISEFAKYIAGASAFVGNQSFGLAIAEALDVPRAVEMCPAGQRAYPLTERGTTRLDAAWLEEVEEDGSYTPFYSTYNEPY